MNAKINTFCNLMDIKSKYILELPFNYLNERKMLNIIHYNKNYQNILNININHFKRNSNIEIEIITEEKEFGKFINILNEKEKPHYYIFLMIKKKKQKEQISLKKIKYQKLK